DWGAPLVYKNTQGILKKQPSTLETLQGWWNILMPVDIDGDGDEDFILGNQGKNLHYTPSAKNIMKLWVNDFDNNGTYEQIITQTINGKDMPIHQKRELTTQMVALKKQNLKASEYAKKSIQELFSGAVLEKTTMKQVTTAETIVVINNGDGTFSHKALPARTQLSCVCGIACADVNLDGTLDIIMGGNNFEFKPQFSRLDAAYGSVLLNNGNFDFEWQSYNDSGFFVKEEVKHILPIKDENGNVFFVVAINNEKPRVFAINN
ncbi:MAG: CRTAC1 family protein, partial [Flavobacteriaceae bacterium]